MAVAFDAVGPSSAGQGHTGVPTGPAAVVESFSHVATGANTIILAGIAIGVQGPDVDTLATFTATCGGTSMTDCGVGKLHANAAAEGFIQVFYILGVTGTVTIAFTQTGYTPSSAAFASFETGSMSFTGVDQTTPFRNIDGATGAGTSATNAVTGGSTNEMVFSFEGGGSAITTHNQTSRFIKNQSTASQCGNFAGATAAGSASTVTMTRTLGSDSWAMIAGALQPAGAGASAFYLPTITIPVQAVQQSSRW